jgi:hypothetical protein
LTELFTLCRRAQSELSESSLLVKFVGSSCSKSFNGSKRLEQLERFEPNSILGNFLSLL